MPRRHNGRMVFPLESGGAEVDQLHPGVPHPTDGLPLAVGGHDLLEVPVVAHEEDVLGLEVGMRDAIVMHKLDSMGQLVGNVAYLKTSG